MPITFRSAGIFIDTNIAMHYKRPDEIDWCDLAKSNNVLLIATPVLLKELDKLKYERSRKLRNRARGYLIWLDNFIEDTNLEIRQKVKLEFLNNNLDIDFDRENLSSSNNDDNLIAHVLQYAKTFKDKIFVATDDTSLKLKLKLRNIERLNLPDDFRLPDEPDLLEVENRNLKKQLERVPKLDASFKNKDKYLVIVYPSFCVEKMLANIDSLEQVKDKHPIIKPHNALRIFGDVENYNKELEKFFIEYEKYVEDLIFRYEVLNLFYKVKFVISNTGTSPATDIDFDLTFPDEVHPVDEDHFQNLLEIPKPPSPPVLPLDRLTNNVFHSFKHTDITNIANLTNIHKDLASRLSAVANNNREPTIDNSKNAVNIHCASLKHGSEYHSDAINFHFKNIKVVKSFNVESKLLANETPTPIKNIFHIKVEKEPRNI